VSRFAPGKKEKKRKGKKQGMNFQGARNKKLAKVGLKRKGAKWKVQWQEKGYNSINVVWVSPASR